MVFFSPCRINYFAKKKIQNFHMECSLYNKIMKILYFSSFIYEKLLRERERETDGRKERRTDRQTDRRIDRER